MQTVVETPTFIAVAEKLFSEEEIAEIIDTVATDPYCGDLMAGTGGFRKFRFAREGMGKRGGARVVYIYRNDEFPVFSHHGLCREPEVQSYKVRAKPIKETC